MFSLNQTCKYIFANAILYLLSLNETCSIYLSTCLKAGGISSKSFPRQSSLNATWWWWWIGGCMMMMSSYELIDNNMMIMRIITIKMMIVLIMMMTTMMTWSSERLTAPSLFRLKLKQKRGSDFSCYSRVLYIFWGNNQPTLAVTDVYIKRWG